MSARLVTAVACMLALVLLQGAARADDPRVQLSFHDASQAWRRPAAAYDVARDRVVLFGGSNEIFDHTAGEGNLAAQTLELGVLWSVRHDSDRQPGPRKRMAHAMAYDTSEQRTFLYGGDTRHGGPGTTLPLVVELLADTWWWSGTAWTKVCDACGPGPLAGHAMVYDESRKRLVLFGGLTKRSLDDVDAVTGATWEHDGVTWVARCGAAGLPTCGPAPRAFAGMTYDAARKKTVLFGGRAGRATATELATAFADTWEWDGTAWVARCGAPGLAACGPQARYEHGMAYHRARNVTTLAFGGYDAKPVSTPAAAPSTIIRQDLWEWDGATWRALCGTTPATSCGGGAGRMGHVLAYKTLPSPERHFMGVFGGHNLPPSNLVFYYDDMLVAVPGTCATTHDCDVGSCVDGVCCETGFCPACQACNRPGAVGRCAPVTNEDHPSCAGTCDEAARCRGKKGASACAADAECASNACADGRCCDRPCSAPCEACSVASGGDVDGTCGPRGARAEARISCGAYVCNGRERTCPARCTSDAECADGRRCSDDGVCVAPPPCSGRFLSVDAKTVDCAPYVCEGTACKATCAATADCTEGNVCHRDRTCGPLDTRVEDDVGCAIGVAGARGAASAAGLAFVAVGVVLAARRRRRA